MNQQIFSPLAYGFYWVGDWYSFDSEVCHQHAFRARNNMAKQLRKDGGVVTLFSLKNQLVSRGGIGTPHPHIELVITVYGLNVGY